MTDELRTGLQRIAENLPPPPAVYKDLDWRERRQVREAYVQQQDGKCWFCRKALTGAPLPSVMSKSINRRLFPKGFFDHPVHLHHSHDTGLTIGAVHAQCNAVLWQYEGQ